MITGKMVDIFLHTIPLISLTNCQLYIHRITTPPFFLPYFLSHGNFIMLPPLFTACDLSCKAETNGFAGTQRGCQLTLPEVFWVLGDQQPLPLPRHPVLQAFPLKDIFFFFFFLGNQMSAVSHPTVKLLIIKANHFKLKGCYQIKDV